MAYETIAETIDELLIKVESAALVSSLREEPDFALIDDLVAKAYRDQVVATT